MTIRTFLALVILALSSSVLLAQDGETPNQARGVSVDTAFQTDAIDAINLFSGNLTLTLPIGGGFPVGGDLVTRLALTYNANAWDFEHQHCQAPEGPGVNPPTVRKHYDLGVPDPLSNAGLGWSLSFGRLLFPDPSLIYPTALHPSTVTLVGPDGTRRTFFSELHPGLGGSSSVLYTNDGSFLRMRDLTNLDPEGDCLPAPAGLGTACRVVDHPDGLEQVFFDIAPRSGSAQPDWRAVRLRDPSGNRLDIDYDAFDWTLTDSLGRMITLTFDTNQDPWTHRNLQEVALPAFDGRTARYRFRYEPATLPRHRFHLYTGLQCQGSNDFDDPSPTVDVELLTEIELPDTSFYRMTYGTFDSASAGTVSGGISTLRTPAGLVYRWKFGPYDFFYPAPSGFEAGNFSNNQTWGVVEKERFADTALTQSLGRWTYFPLTQGGFDLNGPNAEKCYHVTTVTDPLGNDSRHYFSSTRRFDPSFNGLPITVCDPSGSANNVIPEDGYCPAALGDRDCYLSSETFEGSAETGTLVRSTYRTYIRSDPSSPPSPAALFIERNNRMTYEATLYHDDLDTQGAPHWSAVEYSNYDGLGHFRTSKLASSFPDGNGNRTTITHHNPDAGTFPGSFTLPPFDEPWLLERPAFRVVNDGDNHAARTQLCWNDRGQLVGRRAQNGGQETDEDVLVRFDYDSAGNLVGERIYGGDGPADHALPTGCDTEPNHEPVYQTRHGYEHGVRAITDALDACGTSLLRSLDVDIDANTGLASASRDPSGVETLYDYDLMGRLLEAHPVGSAWTDHRYTFPILTDETRPLRYQALRCVPGSDPCQVITGETADYDRLGRLVTATRPMLLDGGVGNVSRTVEYNALGWTLESAEWGLPSAVTTFSDFDRFGRPETITRPDGSVTTSTYRGVREVTTHQEVQGPGAGEIERVVVQKSDSKGRLVSVTEATGASGEDITTTYDYDEGDRLVRVCIDASGSSCGQERSFNYDDRGFLIVENRPEAATVRATFDPTGRVLERTLDGDPDGRFTLSYRYDGAGRVVQAYTRARDAGGALVPRLLSEMSYARDSENGLFGQGKIAQAKRHNYVPRMDDPSADETIVVTERWAYEQAGGRLSTYTQRASNGASFTLDVLGYDALGNVSSLAYPRCDAGTGCGSIADFTLDRHYQSGLLDSIPGYAGALRYHPNGQLASLVHANGAVETRGQDPFGRLEDIRVDSSAGTLWDSGLYAYDASGNIQSIGSESFAYDAANRLVAATLDLDRSTGSDLRSRSYTYDAFGNLRSIDGAGDASGSIALDDATNRLAGSLANYDVAGNVTQLNVGSATFDYRHDATGRMVDLTGNGARRAYLYTAAGERFATLDLATGDATFTPRGLSDEVLSRFRRSGGAWSWLKDYVYAGGQRIATREAVGGSVRVEHAHTDHLGSTRLVTGPSGQFVAFQTYYPYGQNADEPPAGTDPLQFTGHERDDNGPGLAGDLDYMHARYFTSRYGRFLSPDPVRRDPHANRWNLFAYAQGKPNDLVDPDGRSELHHQHLQLPNPDRPLQTLDPPAQSRVYGAGFKLERGILSGSEVLLVERSGGETTNVGLRLGSKLSLTRGIKIGRRDPNGGPDRRRDVPFEVMVDIETGDVTFEAKSLQLFAGQGPLLSGRNSELAFKLDFLTLNDSGSLALGINSSIGVEASSSVQLTARDAYNYLLERFNDLVEAGKTAFGSPMFEPFRKAKEEGELRND